jgi:hypothetical protein
MQLIKVELVGKRSKEAPLICPARFSAQLKGDDQSAGQQ